MGVSLNRLFGALALAGLIGAGSMQASVQAQFHLPVAAHWGSAILKPGDYKILIRDLRFGPNQVVIQGEEGKAMYAMPLAIDPTSASGHSSLQLVERNGTYFVKQYRSASEGKTFTFRVPKLAPSEQSRSIEIEN
jgi:hypothetical protein